MVVGYHHFRKPPYHDLECVLVMACNFETFAETFWQFLRWPQSNTSATKGMRDLNIGRLTLKGLQTGLKKRIKKGRFKGTPPPKNKNKKGCLPSMSFCQVDLQIIGVGPGDTYPLILNHISVC